MSVLDWKTLNNSTRKVFMCNIDVIVDKMSSKRVTNEPVRTSLGCIARLSVCTHH